VRRLSKSEQELGRDRSVRDLLPENLRLLLVGINPSLSSGATGYHFATPGNRLWPALHQSGLTDYQLDPSDTAELVRTRIGITNLVNRATRSAEEVLDEEMVAGAATLRRLIDTCRPSIVAILGLGAFRIAFDQPSARIGRQLESCGSGALWVLPNPSPRNAYYTVPRLVELLRPIHGALEHLTGAE